MISEMSGAPDRTRHGRSSTVSPAAGELLVRRPRDELGRARPQDGMASAISGGNVGRAARTAPHSASYGGGGPTARSARSLAVVRVEEGIGGFSTGSGSSIVELEGCRPEPTSNGALPSGRDDLGRGVRRHGDVERERRPASSVQDTAAVP